MAGRYPGECQNPRCTREDGYCIGYHCSVCGQPSNGMGAGHEACHSPDPRRTYAEQQLAQAVRELATERNALKARIEAAIAEHGRYPAADAADRMLAVLRPYLPA